MKIVAIKEDITHLKTDAIVNASNEDLEPGGGVDYAIHKAAGPKLFIECKKLGGCPTGQAVITKGYNLPAKHVIHTAGPIVWKDELSKKERDLLASCYISCLIKAKESNLRTIAFPAISTGAFGFPKKEAAKIAFDAIKAFAAENPSNIEVISLVAYDNAMLKIYEDTLGALEVTVHSQPPENQSRSGLDRLVHWK